MSFCVALTLCWPLPCGDGPACLWALGPVLPGFSLGLRGLMVSCLIALALVVS